ncbi:MAG: MCE family protein [Proteobacteria bacterium]|nr:MCE family protein [Pseudomonadota bacterium]
MREPSKGMDREVQVGLFVFLACAIIAAFSFRITDTPIFRNGKNYVVFLSDATGIFKNSKVKMAGIDIGVIRKIELEGNRAKLTLLIDKEYEIPKNSIVVPRPLGILGDKFIEIQPQGDSKQGEQIEKSSDESGFNPLDWLVPSASAQQSANELKTNDGSSTVLRSKENAASMDDLLRRVGDVSGDMKVISNDVKGFVKTSKPELTQFIQSINRISKKIENTLKEIDTDQMSKDIKALSKSAGELGKSLEHINSIATKIDNGEGTLGKLVNDPTTVDQLNRTLNTINNVVERARRTRVVVDIDGQYLERISQTKTYLGIDIMPKDDIGYRAELVFDPEGTYKTKVTESSVNGGPVTTTVERVQKKNAVKYSLQFVKRVWNAGIRLGMFESEGGVALDYLPWGKDLTLTAEAFNFGRENDNAHTRAQASLQFLRYFKLNVGVDDIMAKKGGSHKSSFYAGLGLRFDDNDIKLLFVLPGVP